MRISILFPLGVCATSLFFACSDAATSNPSIDASVTVDASVDGTVEDTATEDIAVDSSLVDTAEAGKVITPGLIDPVPYKSFADSPLKGVSYPTYFHLEDFEDGMLNTPGVTSSSASMSGSFGPSLIDSIDGDDGAIDGMCKKDGGTCNSNFGNGTLTYTFDAVALGSLPTHVGVVWTDGSPNCDAIFEAYDAADVLIGTKTATAVGNADNTGTVDEDRFFGVVHTAGVKKVVIKSSAGGVEADHLQYGR